MDEDGFGHGDGFLVRDGNGLSVLICCVRHCEDVLVVLLGGFEWTEKINMNPFIWAFGSRKRKAYLWLLLMLLALHTRTDVLLNILLNRWPRIGVGELEIGPDVSLVTTKEVALNHLS